MNCRHHYTCNVRGEGTQYVAHWDVMCCECGMEMTDKILDDRDREARTRGETPWLNRVEWIN